MANLTSYIFVLVGMFSFKSSFHIITSLSYPKCDLRKFTWGIFSRGILSWKDFFQGEKKTGRFCPRTNIKYKY